MKIELLATSISDKAYDQIRKDIIFGRLIPGQKLRLDRLTRQYGASVSTLREILSRLSSEGLLLAEGQRGFQVRGVSASDFKDVAAMRLLLESHAIRLSFAAGDLHWESQVVAAYHKLSLMEQQLLAGEEGDPESWKRYDREFHQALIAACGSQTLLDLFANVYDQYLRYQMVVVIFRGKPAAEEHRQLRYCVLKRDVERACDVLKKHIEGCVAHTLELGVLK